VLRGLEPHPVCVGYVPVQGERIVGVGTRTASKHTPVLSTKDSYLREEIDPASLGSAHLASNRRAEHRWELQGRRYSRPQGLGHRPSLPRTAQRLTCDDPLRPTKADLVEVQRRQVRADVVKHTRDGTVKLSEKATSIPGTGLNQAALATPVTSAQT
jgi:hypothetical protein